MTRPQITPPASAPKTYYSDDSATVIHGDCIEVMRGMDSSSVDAIVTDPPYGLEFMGKEWDGADGFRRSLNPNDAGRDGAFGRISKTSPEYSTASKAQATRKQVGGIPQATAPSFLGGINPKCLTCDRWQRGSNPCRCEEPEWTQDRLVRLHSFQEWCEAWSRECLRVLRPGGHMLAFGGSRTWHRLSCAVEDAGFEIRDSIAWLYGSGFPKSLNLTDKNGDRTGWGTALKPAFEPIVVGRKPLAGTVASNVLAHGTGAINVDGCRVGMSDDDRQVVDNRSGGTEKAYTVYGAGIGTPVGERFKSSPAGRWPANVILDGSQAAKLDAETGVRSSGANPTRRGVDGSREVFGDFAGQEDCVPARGADSGGASRFFPTFHYEPKAGTAERPRDGDTAHPTVKPVDLMRWLVRLVTPPGGTVLEPFAGSGTTAEACVIEGFKCIAIERDETYLPLIVQRLTKPIQVGLDFGGDA